MERIPPHSPDVEVAVLGAMLQDEAAATVAASSLALQDFYQDRHQLIFQAALRCLNRGIRPDIQTLGEELRRQGKLQEVGTVTLVQIVEAIPTAANVAYHARIVREKAERRGIIQAAERIAAAGYRDQEPMDEYRAQAEAMLFQALQGGQGADILTPSEVAASLDREERFPGLTVGLPLWDEPFPLLTEGRLVVLAGRPGIGKTAMACAVLSRQGLARPPIPTYFISCEQTAREIAERILAIQTGRTLYSIQIESLALPEVQRLATSGPYLSDAGAPSLATVLGQIHAVRATRGIRLVVLDHIGKVSGSRKETRSLEVGDVARGLKAVAKDLRIPVLAVCQLNRLVESRNVKRPPTLRPPRVGRNRTGGRRGVAPLDPGGENQAAQTDGVPDPGKEPSWTRRGSLSHL
jgi:replicative DNA helicase